MLLQSFFSMNSYHRNSLSKEQLEAIVSELQKKVKVLQQRHRRHLEKLLGLENTVSQLRQSNMLNEERLQLLERVKSFKYLHEVRQDYLFPVKQSAQPEMTRGRHWTHPGENTVKMLRVLLFLRLTYRPAQQCRTPARPWPSSMKRTMLRTCTRHWTTSTRSCEAGLTADVPPAPLSATHCAKRDVTNSSGN